MIRLMLAACAVLARNNLRLESDRWQRRGTPDDVFAGEAVAELLVQLAAAFP